MNAKLTSSIFLALSLLFANSAQGQETSIDGGDMSSIAEEACRAVSVNAAHSVYELDNAIMQALTEIELALEKPDGVDKARKRLAELGNEIGPIDRIPKLRMHFLLGYLAGKEGDLNKQQWHRRFAVALTNVMEKNGMGESPDRALRPCLVSNEYDWLKFRAELGRPDSQGLQLHKDRSFDVFEYKKENRSIYFDVTEIIAIKSDTTVSPPIADH
jgi:hypothetical protein